MTLLPNPQGMRVVGKAALLLSQSKREQSSKDYLMGIYM
jgi:hypothetical protein